MNKLFFSFVLLFLCSSLFSQAINTDTFNNRIIQKYYNKSELTLIKANHYDKFKQIKYYYIHSFKLDENSFSNCSNFNPELFDINEYNHLRSKDRQIEIVTNYKVRVKLLSQHELDLLVQYTLPPLMKIL